MESVDRGCVVGETTTTTNFSFTIKKFFRRLLSKPIGYVECSQVFPIRSKNGDGNEFVDTFVIVLWKKENSVSVLMQKKTERHVNCNVCLEARLRFWTKPLNVFSGVWGENFCVGRSIEEKDIKQFLKGDDFVIRCKIEIHHEYDFRRSLQCRHISAAKESLTSAPNVSDILESALKDQSTCDVTIRTGNSRIRCHRFILTLHSEVFRAMFSSGMQESKKSVVDICDFVPETVKKMLVWMYTSKVEDPDSDLLKIAHKYDLQQLFAACELSLCQEVDIDLAAEYFTLGFTYKAAHLMSKSKDIIKRNKTKVKATPGWKCLPTGDSNFVQALLDL